MERHDFEFIQREKEQERQFDAYHELMITGEAQKNYLKHIFETGEIPKSIEMYSDTFEAHVDIRYNEIFAKAEDRIINKLLDIAMVDATIDSDEFERLFEYNLTRYMDATNKETI